MSTSNQIRQTRIQRLIARRMTQSKQGKCAFYLQKRIDVTDLLALRRTLQKQHQLRITANAFYIAALARAAAQMPLMLGTLENDSISIADTVNVGFAVNSAEGLMVPVIKNAHRIPLDQIAQQEKALTTKARSHHLDLEQLEGANIALSNLGAYGIDNFYAIIPPDVTTILSMGNAVSKALEINGQITSRKIVTISLAADRQIISEIYAARYLTLINTILKQFAQGNLRAPNQLTDDPPAADLAV